jgi:hypothetical protein
MMKQTKNQKLESFEQSKRDNKTSLLFTYKP